MDRKFVFESKNILFGTRKVVNYTWLGWSQRKLWWRISFRCWRANRSSKL